MIECEQGDGRSVVAAVGTTRLQARRKRLASLAPGAGAYFFQTPTSST